MPMLRMFIRGLCAFAPKKNDSEMLVFLVNGVRPHIPGIRPHQAQLAYRKDDWISEESDDLNRVHYLGEEWNCWNLNFEDLGFEVFDQQSSKWENQKADSLTIRRGSRKPEDLLLPGPDTDADFDWIPKMAKIHDEEKGRLNPNLLHTETNSPLAIARFKLSKGKIRTIGFVPEYSDGKVHAYQFVDGNGTVREKMALSELACLEFSFEEKIRIYSKELNGTQRLNYVTLAPCANDVVTVCLENRPVGPPNGTTTQSRDTSTFLMTYELCEKPPAVEDRAFPLSTTDEPTYLKSPDLQIPVRFLNASVGFGDSMQLVGKDPESCPFVELAPYDAFPIAPQ